FQQPGLLRLEHRAPKTPAAVPSVKGLQGGFHARPFASLLEDFWRNTKAVFRHLIPAFFWPEKLYPATAVTRPLPLSRDNPSPGG
ncbi:MAG: hypothetical protein AB1405_16850, partial [Bdellovibrionota bacterium]